MSDQTIQGAAALPCLLELRLSPDDMDFLRANGGAGYLRELLDREKDKPRLEDLPRLLTGCFSRALREALRFHPGNPQAVISSAAKRAVRAFSADEGLRSLARL